MHLHFTKIPPPLPPLQIDGHTLQEVKTAKLLGVWVQSDLKWNIQVNHMTKQGSKRLYLLRRLKQFSLPSEDLVVVYTTYIRPVLEYAVPVWSSGLTDRQSSLLESVQRRACRCILGKRYTNYVEACTQLNLQTLAKRRELLCSTFGRKLLTNNLFRSWLPPNRGQISNRRTRGCDQLDTVRARTERFRNSAIPYIVRLLNNLP